ncbi:CBS domain-containing protein [candidate division KSB1 bacterium]|nr:CBS domain-containing protein [candidate division KSB1 bacterium]
MDDGLEDELNRLSSDVAPEPALTVAAFNEPVRKLLSKRAISIDCQKTVLDAVRIMREHEFGAITVTEGGKLVGIFTERDLVVSVNRLDALVSDVMTRDPVSLRESDPIIHAAHNMQVGGYRHIPIVDDEDRPVSIVSIKDVVRYVLDFFSTEVANVLPEPHRGAKIREGA